MVGITSRQIRRQAYAMGRGSMVDLWYNIVQHIVI